MTVLVAGAALVLAGVALAAIARQWWCARRPLLPPGPPGAGPLAVIIPARDEAGTIAAVIARIDRAALAARGLPPRVIVVDDGSVDGTGEAARAAGAERVIRHDRSRGLGASLREGLAAARAEGAVAAVYLDADGEYDAADIPVVLAPLVAGEADYVLGARFPGAARVMRGSRRWGNRAFTLLQVVLTGRRIADGQTGFRAFGPRALARAEIVHDYNYAQVLTLDLLRKRMRLAQVPIAYAPRASGSFIRYGEYLRRVLPAIARELLSP